MRSCRKKGTNVIPEIFQVNAHFGLLFDLVFTHLSSYAYDKDAMVDKSFKSDKSFIAT